MREKVCEKGHVYDSEVYLECPYCNGSNRTISFDADGYSPDIGKTTMGDAGVGKTFMEESASEKNWKTVAPKGFTYKDDSEDLKTVGVIQAPEFNGVEPVAGWLVCIDGPEKGKDYRIRCRVNTVGRSSAMDICIKDESVSRNNNARISYDSRANNFHLIPAESSTNIYLNDRAVYVPTLLSAYDQIEFGKSKMLFIPLCSDRFHWNNDRRVSDDL